MLVFLNNDSSTGINSRYDRGSIKKLIMFEISASLNRHLVIIADENDRGGVCSIE